MPAFSDDEPSSSAFADPGSPVNAHQSSDESTSDGVLVDLPAHSDQDQGREDTFEDAPEQLGSARSLSLSLGESMAMIDFGDSSAAAESRKYKEEREVLRREVAGLRRQLHDLIDRQSLRSNDELIDHLRRLELRGEDAAALSSPTPLHSMIDDCAGFVSHLKSIIDEQLHSESMNRELHAVLYTKDQEIEDLNRKVSEHGISLDVVLSYFTSLREAWKENFLEEAHNHQVQKAAAEERLHQMGQSLEAAESRLATTKEKLGIAVQKGKALVNTRDLLKQQLGEKTKELENCVRELQQRSEALESTQSTVEQLKQSLAEKTSELDQCLMELLQKSDALEGMEASTSELKQSLTERNGELEKCLLELQEKSNTLEIADTNAEKMNRSLDQKTGELENCLLELQHRSNELEAAKASADQLNEIQELANSLQDSLLHRDKVLQEIEELMSQNDPPEDLVSLDIIDRVRWFTNQKHISDGILQDNLKIRNTLSSMSLPETVLSLDLESQVNWLGQSFTKAQDDLAKTQNEIAIAGVGVASHELELSEAHGRIDSLATALMEEKRGKDSVQYELEDLKGKFKEMAENISKISLEKDRLLKVLAELSESSLDDEIPASMDALIERFVSKVRQRAGTYIVEGENFNRMQSLLYVNDVQQTLCENILEEVMSDRSEAMSLSTELGKASEEITRLRNEKDSLRSELERVEERSSQLRERLSIAVRKGKGLMHERDNLKQSLEEKDTEINILKDEQQIRDSAIANCNEQIKNLSAYPEHIQKLESDIVSLKEQKDEIEQFLQESNSTLQKLLDSLEAVVLPTDENFEGPLKKVNWIAEYVHKAEIDRTNAKQELEKIKEEANSHAGRLSDAFTTIKSLEDELFQAKKQIIVFTEENKDIKLDKSSVDQELEKVKEETHMQAKKIDDANTTIKSLEDSLLKAETHISELSAEKNEAESKSKQETDTLNLKLAECVEELAKTSGSLEDQSNELVSYLRHLQMLMQDGNLMHVWTEELRKKFDGLRNMALLVQNMHDQFAAKGLQVHPGKESREFAKLFSLPTFEDFNKGRIIHPEAVVTGLDDVSSTVKIVEELIAQFKHLKDSFQELSIYSDNYIAYLTEALQVAKDEFICMLELSESLKVNIHRLEAHNEGQEVKMSSLQGEITTLNSACTDATQELQIEFRHLLDLHSDTKQDKVNLTLDSSSEVVGSKEDDAGESAKLAKSLIHAVRGIRIQLQQLASDQKILMTSNDDLKHKLEQAELSAATAIQDRHVNQEKVAKLEVDLEALNNTYREMKLKLEDYQAKEDILKDKEEELLQLQHTLTTTGRGLGDLPFSQEQMETLIGKVNKMEISSELETVSHEVQFSNPLDKLFYILDKVSDLQRRLDSLAYEKEDMQLILSSHVREVEHLKKATETTGINYKDLESKKTELSELTVGLERIIQRLGGNYPSEDQKPLTTKGLLQFLDQLTIASTTESENLKSRIQEVGAKLQAKESIVDELSVKVKSLEDSINARFSQPDTVKERTVFESSTSPSGSEISEIEEMGALMKNSASPPSAAAHVRTMRKGSTEHLVLNIDSESDRLIRAQETDDKGHFFKSLNTSGFIPKEGKLIADRIDGVWVSGGRVLMSRPGARLGLIGYWIFLHLWLLGTVL